MALVRVGGRRIDDYDDATDTKKEAVYCRLLFDHTVQWLMKDHYWPFAKRRVQLSQDPAAVPSFQYLYAYHLPNGFLRAILVHEGSDIVRGKTYSTYEIEGSHLLSNNSTCYLIYTRWVTDVGSWDDLFINCIVLTLAPRLAIARSQSLKIKAEIKKELDPYLRQARAIDRQEEQVIGRAELRTWQDARWHDTA
jgi:hypothetical protein